MGEGDPVAAVEKAFPLRPHPLADADTLRRKLAKASLRGEGQGEGRDASDLLLRQRLAIVPQHDIDRGDHEHR